MCAETEKRAKQSYLGNALWLLVQAAFRGKSEYPKWNDLFGLKREEEKQTAKEVIGNLLKDLR